MKGRFNFPMIKVVSGGGGGESPDPAIYCPANNYHPLPNPATFCPINGYIPDPSAYVPDPILTEIIPPASGKIRLVVEDAGLRTISVLVSVSNSGKYQVTIIGQDNTQLSQVSYANNNTSTIILPSAPGFLSNEGYRYYYVDITPELPANNLLTFRTAVNATYDDLGGYVIAAFINAPTLTSLANAFNGMRRIRYIEFLSESPSLTTLTYFACFATSLRKLIFVTLPEVVSMSNMLYGTNYVDVVFPTSLPKLSTAASMLNSSKCRNFVFNFEAPLLQDLSSCFNKAEVPSITFTAASFPELTTIYYFCKDAIGLKGTVNYPLMPKLTNMASVHENNLTVEQIIFNGAMNSLNNWLYLANGCFALKKLVLPESILGMTTLSTSATATAIANNCNNLEELVLPKVFKPTAGNTNGYFLNHLTGCIKLKTISTIEETNNLQCGYFNGSFLMALERWDQPNAFWTTNSASLSFTKTAGTLGKLEYLEMDWENWPKVAIGVERNNFDFPEIRRILARQNPLKNQSFHLFQIMGNPLIDYNCLGDPTSLGMNHTLKILKSSWKSHVMKVGTSMIAQQNSQNPQLYIKADNTFTLYSAWTRAPLNGTKVVFATNTYSSYGLLPYKVFYIVNSEEYSGNVFQLSETLGGQPYAFNFGPELVNTIVNFLASNNIVSITSDATYYTCICSFPYYPNSGSRYAWFVNPDVFDWWEMIEKGYKPY